MNLTTLGANQTVITLANGDQVFYSYNTPVAAFISGRGFVRTEEKHSSTTSKHINKWSRVYNETLSQSFFDNLVKTA